MEAKPVPTPTLKYFTHGTVRLLHHWLSGRHHCPSAHILVGNLSVPTDLQRQWAGADTRMVFFVDWSGMLTKPGAGVVMPQLGKEAVPRTEATST